MVLEEFDYQINNLIQKGYPGVADISEEQFLNYVEPLKNGIKKLVVPEKDIEEGFLPFVIVIKNELVSAEKAMPLVEREGKHGIVSMYPVKPESFRPIDGVNIPNSTVYLLGDIDRGKETINVAPHEALKRIQTKNRSPLTIDEGIAVITHYPGFLKKNNCFSMLASRRGDQRVPALWLSEGRPKLGWCWAGNPHTWLGSASCGARDGL